MLYSHIRRTSYSYQYHSRTPYDPREELGQALRYGLEGQEEGAIFHYHFPKIQLSDDLQDEVKLTTPEKHVNDAFTALLVNILKGLHVDKGDSPPPAPHNIDGPITNDDYYEIRLAKSLFKFLQEVTLYPLPMNLQWR